MKMEMSKPKINSSEREPQTENLKPKKDLKGYLYLKKLSAVVRG